MYFFVCSGRIFTLLQEYLTPDSLKSQELPSVKTSEKKFFCVPFSHEIYKAALCPKNSGVYRFILLKLRLHFPDDRLKIKWYFSSAESAV